ncbi:hypothetical protein [Streptomyces ipomoeae]|uniref:hypothetical protein n=1 Tax=Streptomyces ipomoeae TaxID=103232 RepID=UPI0015F05BCB|nr:hypothetical protein [Streptomyces ipomoeae]MDX2932378.1 hypothetical protein [Streptomyces ipomoeae]
MTSYNSPSEVGPACALIDGSSIYDERNDGSSTRLGQPGTRRTDLNSPSTR